MSERDDQCAANTDRELWREGDGDGNGMSYYADSIHVTEHGLIGINCGGTVYVRPVREWHGLVSENAEYEDVANSMLDALLMIRDSKEPDANYAAGVAMSCIASLNERGQAHKARSSHLPRFLPKHLGGDATTVDGAGIALPASVSATTEEPAGGTDE